MSEWIAIVFDAMFAGNLALVYLLGMCTFLAVSQRVETAIGLGLAVIVVETLTVPANQLLYQALLRPGALAWLGYPDLDLGYLRFLTFIGLIAALIQLLDVVLDRFFPALRAQLGIYLPLLTLNCAVLGASLFMVQRGLDLPGSVAYGFGAGAGWALAVVLFAAIRERLRYSDVPRGLQGIGLAFVVTGLMSLAFGAFAGVSGGG